MPKAVVVVVVLTFDVTPLPERETSKYELKFYLKYFKDTVGNLLTSASNQ